MRAQAPPKGSLQISNHIDQGAAVGTHCFSAIGVRYPKWPLPATGIADFGVATASHFESAMGLRR